MAIGGSGVQLHIMADYIQNTIDVLRFDGLNIGLGLNVRILPKKKKELSRNPTASNEPVPINIAPQGFYNP